MLVLYVHEFLHVCQKITILQYVLVHKSSLPGHRTLVSGYPFLATFLCREKVRLTEKNVIFIHFSSKNLRSVSPSSSLSSDDQRNIQRYHADSRARNPSQRNVSGFGQQNNKISRSDSQGLAVEREAETKTWLR